MTIPTRWTLNHFPQNHPQWRVLVSERRNAASNSRWHHPGSELAKMSATRVTESWAVLRVLEVRGRQLMAVHTLSELPQPMPSATELDDAPAVREINKHM